MLLDGFNHVAILTNDSARLHTFYEEVFDATVLRESLAGSEGPVRLTLIYVGPYSELNVFEIDGNDEAVAPDPDVRARPHRPPRAPGGVDRVVRDDP